MARTIAQRELRNENAKVIEAVTAGETFIVTRHGEPVAELRPAELTAGPHLATDAVNRRPSSVRFGPVAAPSFPVMTSLRWQLPACALIIVGSAPISTG